MKLLFLGTGAAGSLKRTEAEMPEGSRRCASLRIDENVLVDVARQSFDYTVKLGKDPSSITDIFLSHAHGDHFCRDALMQYAAAAKEKIRFWCHKGAVEHLNLSEEDLQKIDLRPVEICDTWETAGMTVTALPANHLVGSFTCAERPLHYIFEKDGKKLYYGCDGGWYTAIEWEYMRANKVVFDAVIMDATVGEDAGNFRIATHNNLAMIRLLTLALRQNEMLAENALLIATHFANSCYDKSRTKEEVFGELGMIPAFDGKELEI
ncbi:MAG: MBL fold metallo-hydrolase [Clostridia bacterium]|nr:MBL fold metallo-hydrolase [Clostridia bacterium]